MAVLYKANETDFNHLGLGPLNDAVSIFVTEERNGMFELEMKYPIEGSRFVDLKLDRMIKADAGYNLKNQRFKIIRITKPIDGIVTVNAEHVSYLTQDLSLRPTVNYSGNASQALTTWNNNLVDDSPFIVASDITTTGSGSWSIKDVKNAREALGGVSGSILETYGGEYRFDNYSIRLMAQRGVNSGALIAYGRNLVDLTQEESIADTFTSVYPYAVYQDGNNKEVLLTLPEYFIDSEYVGNYARRKILPVDFSNDKIKDVATLRTRTTSYIKSNGIGIPKVNMKINYIDLAKTLDYKDLAVLEEINLCDNVFVYFEQLGVNTSAKIIKTVWDDLLKQYDSIEVGEAKSGLSNSINATVDGKLETIVQRVNTIQLTADGLNVIHRGPEEPPPGNVGDLWYEPDGIYENMYQWDGVVWKLMLSTRDLGVLKQEVESVIEQADADRTEAVQKINQAVIDSKVYADEVTTVSALRTKVLASDVITADMIQSNVSVVDKLFATDANVNRLTAKTAFINSVKAVNISADKVTTGTLNAANVNLINVNVSSLVGNTSSFIQSNWNGISSVKITSEGVVTSASDGSQTVLKDGRLLARAGSGGTFGSFGSAQGVANEFTIDISNGNSFSIRYNRDAGGLNLLRLLSFDSTTIYARLPLSMENNNINNVNALSSTLINASDEIVAGRSITVTNGGYIRADTSGGASLFRPALMGNNGVSFGLGTSTSFTRLMWMDNTRIYMNRGLSMEGNAITNSPSVSDARLKNVYGTLSDNSLNKLMGIEYVKFKWLEDNRDDFGFIAQQVKSIAPEIMRNVSGGYLGYDSQGYTHLIGHAVQQLNKKVGSIDSLAIATNAIANNAMNKALQVDSEVQQMKDKISELDEKIKLLESVE